MIQPGAVGPGWQPYNSETEEQLAHQIKIYNNANEKKYLMKCDADSYFRLTNCLYKNKKIEKNFKNIRGWGRFSTKITGYEYEEIFSYERKQNRHKVSVIVDGQSQYLWLAAEPPFGFSSYLERVAKDADGFSGNWDKRLFLSPHNNKYVRTIFSKFYDFTFSVKKIIKKGENVWLQLGKIEDHAASCGNYVGVNVLYEDLWVPLFNKRHQFNVSAFTIPKGC